MLKIECLIHCENYLGEGPVWDADNNALFWVDGTGRRKNKPTIWRYDPASAKIQNWNINRDIGAMALRQGGGAVLALDDGFYFYDFNSVELEPIKKVDEDEPRTRLNDGKCDRRGRFFAGGMDDKEELPICGLWKLDVDLSVSLAYRGIICSNGPCWSPDNRRFYLADTFQQEYWAWDYDIDSGTLSNKSVLINSKGKPGFADGSTIDEEGFLWNAELITGELVRYAPDGSEDRRIGMPVRNVTSVMFGGEKLDELYVTSMGRVDHPAIHDHFTKEVKPQYLAGSLFKVSGLGVRGLPEPKFAG
ncbi:MAG: SMP-30/gluconolactonase/LRE family protein [Bordetella sp.]